MQVKPGAIALSLTKGMRVRADGPQLISAMVRKSLGLDCSVLMGPNIATVSEGSGRGRRMAYAPGPWGAHIHAYTWTRVYTLTQKPWAWLGVHGFRGQAGAGSWQ